jgi:hypothetical protein
MFRDRKGLLLLTTLVLALGTWACSGGQKALEEPPAPATADEAVRQVLSGLADGRPEVLWYALPASYQQDINDLVHEAAERTDPELWNRSFGVLGKVSRVLHEKQEFILDHPMIASQVADRKEADRNWKAVVGMFDTIVKSDLADVDTVKNMDVGVFLATTGGTFMGQLEKAASMTEDNAWAEFTSKMRSMQIEVVSAEGDSATLRMQPEGEQAVEQHFTRVEGKWILADMAAEWDDTIANARESLVNATGQQDAATQQMALMQLGMVESALDGILAADTGEEFNASIGGIMGMAMSAAMARANSAGNQGNPSISPMSSPPTGVAPSFPQPPSRPSLPSQPAPSSLSIPRSASTATAPSQSPPPSARDTIAVGEAVNHVGQFMRVLGKDGMDFNGTLTAANDDTLTFERRFGGGGTASFEIPKSEIDTLKINR